MAVRLKCPVCEEKFRWEFNDANRWPRNCPMCGSFVGIDRPDDEIVMPAIRSANTRRNDQVYRDMEAASEVRAEQAAVLAGTTAADMSSLKITNLNDRKDAEVAAPTVNNAVSQFMHQTGVGGATPGAQGLAYSNAVSFGPHPNSGARMRSLIQGQHQDMAAKVAPGSDAMGTVSQVDALETIQPGYRRRA